jgi:hypothetical protein
MNRSIFFGAAIALAVVVAQPASAQFAFGSSSGSQMLITDSGSVDTGGFQGWVSTGYGNTGGPGGNTNYIVGSYGGADFNDYFVFSTDSFTGPVTAASLSVNAAYTLDSVALRLGAASSLIGSLYNAASPDTALHDALGSGTSYGSFSFDGSDYFQQLTFTLNAAGLADLNAAIANHQSFAIGGSLNASSPTPEPASWAMMVGGFGVIGGALRSRRRAAVTFA